MSSSVTSRGQQRRIALATVVGTTIEWYDFFIYSTAAALVFAQLYFAPAGPAMAQVLAFVTVGISFLFRPLGAFLAGHFGDRLGRRTVLVVTLVMMGAGTALIGLIPSFDAIGLAAPLLLILLRIVQGISAGGEWGGAVLMAVEHADPDRRGRAGALPQLGVPLGMLLASGVMALMTGVIAPGEAFTAWGWRLPFLLSLVLVAVGYVVRRSVDESPIFKEIALGADRSKVPAVTLFRRYGLLVLLAALVFAGNNAGGYMTTGGFVTKYATSDAVGLGSTEVLLAVSCGSAVWLIVTWWAGRLADSIGRVRTYQCGFVMQILSAFPLFWLINTGSLVGLYAGLALFAVGLGLSYGPQAALYSELFPASVRFSGVSISYALGAILGGAFAPTIAQALMEATGGTAAISWYLLGMAVVSLVAVSLLRDRSGIDLSVRNEEEQAHGATVFSAPRAAVPSAAPAVK